MTPEQEAAMDTLCKFKIGDLVQFLGVVEAAPGEAITHPCRVVGRFAEECPGGIQRHYHLRAISYSSREWRMKSLLGGVHTALFKANEDELELYVKPTEDEPE